MAKATNLSQFRYTQKRHPRLGKLPTKVPKLYVDKLDYQKKLTGLRDDIHELQGQLYAHNRHAVLAIFQAMDAAGKDSTIEHVFCGVDPQGVDVHSFKAPTSLELDHDFLWRSLLVLPPRGKIGVHNRSYYEEVLICRIHPEIITQRQRLPENLLKNMNKLFKQRHESIRDLEKHLTRNGTKVIKFFLNVSQEEQRKRLLSRIEEPAKNWKFETGDLAEREHWPEYMKAYEETIRETATEDSPWYIIPADDKRNMRLLTAMILRNEIKALKPTWPTINHSQREALEQCRTVLEKKVL